MISEYLKKFQSELITNKEEIHKSIQTLELQIHSFAATYVRL